MGKSILAISGGALQALLGVMENSGIYPELHNAGSDFLGVLLGQVLQPFLQNWRAEKRLYMSAQVIGIQPARLIPNPQGFQSELL